MIIKGSNKSEKHVHDLTWRNNLILKINIKINKFYRGTISNEYLKSEVLKLSDKPFAE